MTSSFSESFIEELENSLESDDLHNCNLEFSVDPGPSGGFLANTYLAVLKGTNKSNETETLQVFIKCGKEGEFMQGLIDTNMAYEREIYMYSHVFPALKAFINRKNVSFNFDFIPICYGAVSVQNIPVIVLENLGTLGYRLHDAIHPMNIDHMKLVYDNYAKLHASSFAFKEQNYKEYEEFARQMTPIAEQFWSQDCYKERYEIHNEKTCKLLTDSGHAQLMERWRKYLSKGSLSIFKEASKFQVAETAITHMDCWNNNMMFKYQADDLQPTNVKLLDFQISQIQSPILDLCPYFFFTCSSETVKHFDDIIQFYYQRFSSYMHELGSDPEKAFPLSTLKRHWREYSIFPCLQSWHGVHTIMRDKSDTTKFEDLDHPGDFMFRDMKMVDIELYKDRLVAAVTHYCDYVEKYSAY